MAQSSRYNLIVIGGGSAGLTAARTAAALGARVALVDRERLGGECLWTGCVPSKSLIASANAAHLARNMRNLGLGAELAPVDLGAVMARVQDVIGAIDQHDNAAALRHLGIDVRLGDAVFRSPHDLEVDGQMLSARAFLICSGSHAAIPPIDGLSEIEALTNETIFGLRRLPDHLIVAGGGPVGVEMAQAFRRLGARVTVLAGERGLLPREDSDVSAALGHVFAGEGIAVIRSRLVHVRREGNGNDNGEGICVGYAGAGGHGETHGDQVLLALGRQPNVEGLGLQTAGVAYDSARGIHIDVYLRTSAPHIFACGDVTGPYQFTHAAGFQATTAVRNALFPRLKSTSRLEPMPWTTFTAPEIAHVGLTEQQARSAHGRVLVLRASLALVDRAQTEGDTAGFVKLIVSPWRGRILGGHIVGAHAGELIQEVTIAMSKGLSASALAGIIHVYPTYSMAVQQAALGFYGQWPLARLAGGPIRLMLRAALRRRR